MKNTLQNIIKTAIVGANLVGVTYLSNLNGQEVKDNFNKNYSNDEREVEEAMKLFYQSNKEYELLDKKAQEVIDSTYALVKRVEKIDSLKQKRDSIYQEITKSFNEKIELMYDKGE